MPTTPAAARTQLELAMDPSGENRQITFVFGNGAYYFPLWRREDFECLVAYATLRAVPYGPEADWPTALRHILTARDKPRLLQTLRKYCNEFQLQLTHLPSEQIEEGVWMINEAFRLESSRCVDGFDTPAVYSAAVLLAKADLVKSIFTTNYDLSIEAVFRSQSFPYAVNPCADTCGPKDGFNSVRTVGLVPIWKPHGRLDFYADHTAVPPASPHHIASDAEVAIGVTGTQFARHFHDYNGYDRWEHMSSEIGACCDDIDQLGHSDIAIVVGFTGHWDANDPESEEISPRIVNAMGRGLKVLQIHRWGGKPAHSYLWNQVDQHPLGCCVRSKNVIWETVWSVVVKCKHLYTPLKPLIHSV